MKREHMAAAVPASHPTRPHHQAVPGGLPRRQFHKAVGGAGILAAGIGAAGRAAAAGPGPGQLLPIPTTVEFFPGVGSHVLAPPFLVGPDSDPSTVYNFRGASGIAFITGECERRNRKTGEVRTLPYVFNDMRFMDGTVRNRGGHEHPVTLGFI